MYVVCLAVQSVILRNIEASDWKEPTAIQMQAIPLMLNNRDVLAAAPTGSGKTAAFVLPVLSRVAATPKGSRRGLQALLLAPTRELTEQIHREAERLSAGKRLKIGVLKKNLASAALAKQEKSAFDKYDILVATPMRLVTLINAEVIDLSNVKIVVLDEADKLFEMDSGSSKLAEHEEVEGEDEDDEEHSAAKHAFLNQVDTILASCSETSENLQRALFSATITPFVTEVANGFLRDAVTLRIGQDNAAAELIDQKMMFVGTEEGKLLAIRQLFQQGLKPPALIFLQNKERAKELFKELIYDGINVDVMHAERTQAQREEVITKFRSGEIWVLICTDLMARGIDFKGVNMVINYDLPTSAVAYIHRIGRTGRAGNTGTAITFFTEADMPNIRSIANVVKLSGCDVPDWMLKIKQLTTKKKREIRIHAPERRDISTVSGYDKMKQNRRKSAIDFSKQQKRGKVSELRDRSARGKTD
jgi:ATP-dependent RNA helicase DDX52/ROK1